MGQFWIEVFAPIIGAILSWVGWKAIKLLRDIRKQVYPNGGGSMFDIVTDTKNAIATHDAKFKAYQDADVVMTFEADMDGRVRWTNTGIENAFGMSGETMTGFDIFNGIDPAERESVKRKYKSCVADEMGFDCNFTLRNGTWLRMVASPVGVGKSRCYSGHCESLAAPLTLPPITD